MVFGIKCLTAPWENQLRNFFICRIKKIPDVKFEVKEYQTDDDVGVILKELVFVCTPNTSKITKIKI